MVDAIADLNNHNGCIPMEQNEKENREQSLLRLIFDIVLIQTAFDGYKGW